MSVSERLVGSDGQLLVVWVCSDKPEGDQEDRHTQHQNRRPQTEAAATLSG
ncbi:MAG: hypothetical protein MK165_20060 [Pirellulaceae bacterium]|nr:hypothetical protein [Pirellulaceae bacterium]